MLCSVCPSQSEERSLLGRRDLKESKGFGPRMNCVEYSRIEINKIFLIFFFFLRITNHAKLI